MFKVQVPEFIRFSRDRKEFDMDNRMGDGVRYGWSLDNQLRGEDLSISNKGGGGCWAVVELHK